MKQIIFASFAFCILAACSTPKTYFTRDVRNSVETSSIPLTKLQFYVDRDVELKREVASGATKVTAGMVKYENGKYVNIITLKKNTPGVCTKVYGDKIDVAFETGDGKHLTFGKLQRDDRAPYTLYADSWGPDLGAISYDGQKYFIMPSGAEARLMIKKNVLNTSKVDKREMKGVKVQG